MEDTSAKGSPALGRGRSLSFTTNLETKVHPYEQKVMDCRHKQKMSISSHASEALDHRHVLLQGLPHRTLATVILVGHGIDWIYKKGRKLLQGLKDREMQRNRSGCQYRCVRGWSPQPVFEDMKRRDGRLGTRKGQPQLIRGEAPFHQCRRD